MEPVTLRTARLVLRPYALDDWQAVLDRATNPEFRRFLPLPDPYTGRHAQEFVAMMILRSWETHPTFAITLAGDAVGDLNLRIDRLHRTASVGYGVACEYWGRGITTEAVRAAFAWAFATKDLVRIEATADAENAASWRVMEKAGKTREALFRKYRVLNGQSAPESGTREAPNPSALSAFVAGRIIAGEGDALVVQSGTTNDAVRLRPRPDIRIAGAASWSAIQVGDQVAATGVDQRDGSVLVGIVDVNITLVHGLVTSIVSDSAWTITLQPKSDPELMAVRDAVTVRFDQQNPPLDPNGRPVSLQILSAVPLGSTVSIVGVLNRSDMSIVVHRFISHSIGVKLK